MRAIRTQHGLVPIIGLLIATAWAALWLWAQSPYGRYLDHGRWTEIGIAADICRALPKGDILLPGLLYIGGWLLMTAAMMLPTALPLLRRFERLTSARADRRVLVGLLMTGYLFVWVAFGLAAHLLDAVLHLIVRQSIWLTVNGWLLGAIVLAMAGAFQFTRLKYRCLDRCRTPLGFIAQYWRGRQCRVHARARRHHGGRKERGMGAGAEPSARFSLVERRGDHNGRQHRLVSFVAKTDAARKTGQLVR
jgi:predicted metal-binding membrane protein